PRHRPRRDLRRRHGGVCAPHRALDRGVVLGARALAAHASGRLAAGNGRRMTLVVHELGDPARPPLVFLHALGVGTSGCYVAEIAPLLRRRVLGVDGAGFGASPALEPAGYALDSYVPRVLAVLDELGVDRTALM